MGFLLLEKLVYWHSGTVQVCNVTYCDSEGMLFVAKVRCNLMILRFSDEDHNLTGPPKTVTCTYHKANAYHAATQRLIKQKTANTRNPLRSSVSRDIH